MKNNKEHKSEDSAYIPQVKICGLTGIDDAVKCASLGADAIGLVFYPKSPRFVTDGRAREICLALPDVIRKVGVFVDDSYSSIMQKVEKCGINAVQLHGNESPELAGSLMKEGLIVIKALFLEKKPDLEDAKDYDTSAFLVEFGKGALPGGNALSWDWEKAKELTGKYPYILAGGLTPENVCQAVSLCLPDGVDVSSGVESAPGIKDIKKIEKFIINLKSCSLPDGKWRIF